MGLLSSIIFSRTPSSPFRDRSLNSQYHRDGYVTMPLAGRQEINRLRALHEGISRRGSTGFHATNFSTDRKLKPLHMKAGEALIYDDRLFHASDPNITDELRLAAVSGIIPQEAQVLYYFGREGKVDVYESSVEFFMTGDIQKGPEVLRKTGAESV